MSAEPFTCKNGACLIIPLEKVHMGRFIFAHGTGKLSMWQQLNCFTLPPILQYTTNDDFTPNKTKE